MRSRWGVVAGVVLLLSAVAVTSWRRDVPDLVIDESVAPDFEEVAIAAWDTFIDAFPAHAGCIGRVSLIADHNIDDRAKYDPDGRTILVRVPGPRVLLDRAVIHELAHHLEFVCPQQATMRADFLAALGRQDDPWFEGSEWGTIPSEIFAESVVEYVLDERGTTHTDMGLISQEAVEVLVEWAHR